MKNQKSIHEMIDINKVINDIDPKFCPCCNSIWKDYLFEQVVELTVGQYLCDETDDIWFDEIYQPILNHFLSKEY